LGEQVDYLIARLLPPLGHDVILTVASGHKLFLPKGYRGYQAYQSGMYEPDTTRVFIKLLCEGQNVVDVGSHIGYYTILAAAIEEH
jgi:hypothetical protein